MGVSDEIPKAKFVASGDDITSFDHGVGSEILRTFGVQLECVECGRRFDAYGAPKHIVEVKCRECGEVQKVTPEMIGGFWYREKGDE